MLERNEVVGLAKRCMPVKYEGHNYNIMGYKVEFDREGEHLSVCLLDGRRCKRWVDYRKVEKVMQ